MKEVHLMYKRRYHVKAIIKYIAIALGVITFCYSFWLQIDFENYIDENQYKYKALEVQKRIKYTPAIVFIIGKNVFGQYKDDLFSSQVISTVGRFNGHQLKDAYVAHCYYDESLKRKILSGDSSIVQKLLR